MKTILVLVSILAITFGQLQQQDGFGSQNSGGSGVMQQSGFEGFRNNTGLVGNKPDGFGRSQNETFGGQLQNGLESQARGFGGQKIGYQNGNADSNRDYLNGFPPRPSGNPPSGPLPFGQQNGQEQGSLQGRFKRFSGFGSQQSRNHGSQYGFGGFQNSSGSRPTGSTFSGRQKQNGIGGQSNGFGGQSNAFESQQNGQFSSQRRGDFVRRNGSTFGQQQEDGFGNQQGGQQQGNFGGQNQRSFGGIEK